MARILIKGGRVWDGDRFFFSDVLCEGGRVASISEKISVDADHVYDASGKTVCAGFVDAHVHMRGISIDKYGISAEMSCLPFGVTAAADASGVKGDAALLDSFGVKGTVFVEAPIENNRPLLSITEAGLARFGDRAVGVKVYFDTEVSGVENAEPLIEICKFARERGLRVMVHSSHSPIPMAELLDTLSEGDILTHAYHGGRNNSSEDAFEALKAAKARGVVIDAGFAGHVHTDFGVFREAIKSSAFPNVISTDVTRLSSYVRGGRYGMTLCMSIARHLGMNEEDIFRAVTSAPAKALGKTDEWGSLAVGRAADIAVIEYTDERFDLTDGAGNRVCSDKGYRCVLTVVDGQIVYKD